MQVQKCQGECEGQGGGKSSMSCVELWSSRGGKIILGEGRVGEGVLARAVPAPFANSSIARHSHSYTSAEIFQPDQEPLAKQCHKCLLAVV